MWERFFEMLLLSWEEILKIESSASNVPVLVGVHVVVRFSDDVSEYLTEMEGWVKVEKVLNSFNDGTGRI